MAIEQFDLKNYDLILSSSHCVAKGVLCHPDQLHICYCYTPMRYAWDLSLDYLKEAGLEKGLKGTIAKIALHYLRGWDVHSSHRVDHFVAISKFVARRIKRVYGREADVIYPPVNTAFFQPKGKKEEFYLAASRLVSYKKIDLIVEAFTTMPDRKLVVIGDGPEMAKIRKIAGSNVELMGYQSDAVLLEMMQKAKAFVFAAVEDFGIVPLEAMAAGTPVIALRKGGVAELVIESVTGLFFEEQTIVSIRDAVERFERIDGWDTACLRNHALQFSQERFRAEYKNYVEEKKLVFKEKLNENSHPGRWGRNAPLATVSTRFS
jgi:glycosyltransferase involved in cell wall biosynthesis